MSCGPGSRWSPASSTAVEVWPALEPVVAAARLGADVPPRCGGWPPLPGAAGLRGGRRGVAGLPALRRRPRRRPRAGGRRRRRERQAHPAPGPRRARLGAGHRPAGVRCSRSRRWRCRPGIGGDPWHFLLATPVGLGCLGARRRLRLRRPAVDRPHRRRGAAAMTPGRRDGLVAAWSSRPRWPWPCWCRAAAPAARWPVGRRWPRGADGQAGLGATRSRSGSSRRPRWVSARRAPVRRRHRRSGRGGARARSAAGGPPRRMEPPAVRRRRERLAAAVPHVVDLMAACLAAGLSPAAAVEQIAAAVDAAARRRAGGPRPPGCGWGRPRHRVARPRPAPAARRARPHAVPRASRAERRSRTAMQRLAEDLRRQRARRRGEPRPSGRGQGRRAARGVPAAGLRAGRRGAAGGRLGLASGRPLSRPVPLHSRRMLRAGPQPSRPGRGAPAAGRESPSSTQTPTPVGRTRRSS